LLNKNDDNTIGNLTATEWEIINVKLNKGFLKPTRGKNDKEEDEEAEFIRRNNLSIIAQRQFTNFLVTVGDNLLNNLQSN
jgi:hypothetical protein